MRKSATKGVKTLNEAQFEALKNNARGILTQTRKLMLDRFPFVGSIAMGLDLVPTRDCRNPTMCTDGTAIYSDIDFLSKLSNDDKIFVLAHEVYHNVMLHLIRCGSRNPELFNIATDMEVNDILREDGLSVPKFVILPDNFGFERGKNAEYYYERLIKSKAKVKDNKSNNIKQTSKQSSNQNDDKLNGQFDKHCYSGDKQPEFGPENTTDRYGKVGYDSDYRPNVSKSAVERIRGAAIVAAQTIERQCGRGKLPGHLKRLINELLEPKINWREALAKFLTKANGDSIRTWNKCNRRFIGSKLYLPSSYSNAVRVGVVIDTSGSVMHLATKFMSEVNGIVSQFDDYSIDVVQCDTQVNKTDHYDQYNQFDSSNVNYEMHGGGGTILTPALKWFDEHAPDVDCIVVFTDTFCEDMNEKNKPNVPVLWLSTTKGPYPNIHFGDIVEFNVDDDDVF